MSIFPDLFSRYGHEYGNRIAVVAGDREVTFREMTGRVHRLANALLGLGVRPGKTVALISDNCSEFLEVFFARYLIGATELTVNTRLLPGEWARQILETDASVVIGSSEHLESLLATAGSELDRVDVFVAFGKPMERAASYEDLIGSASESPPTLDHDLDTTELRRVVYTSGTTGNPKGVMLTWAADLAQVRNMLIDLVPDFRPGHVFLGLQPMYHAVRPFFFPTWIRGVTHVIVPEFGSKVALEAIEANRVTHLKTVPTVLSRILEDPDLGQRDLSSVLTVIYGGSPMPIERLKEAIRVFGPILVQNYGQTESAMTVSTLRKEDHIVDPDDIRSRRLNSVGRAYSWVDVRILDDAGAELGPGAVGEVAVRGDHNMVGYLGDPESTARALRGGWVLTGDIGTKDDEGYIYLLDRHGDMIISGAENIYPTEIEQVLYQHDAIKEACVFGVPDAVWGESVAAMVVLEPGMSASEDDIIRFSKERLPSYKCPKRVFYSDVLPRNEIGKVLRKDIRAPWWNGHERAIH